MKERGFKLIIINAKVFVNISIIWSILVKLRFSQREKRAKAMEVLLPGLDICDLSSVCSIRGLWAMWGNPIFQIDSWIQRLLIPFALGGEHYSSLIWAWCSHPIDSVSKMTPLHWEVDIAAASSCSHQSVQTTGCSQHKITQTAILQANWNYHRRNLQKIFTLTLDNVNL